MNLYLGGFATTDGGWPWAAPYRISLKSAEISPPAKLFVFLDMREDMINWGSFLTSMQGYSPPSPTAYQFMDFPGMAHEKGCGFTFADGHAEMKRWLDPRTMPPLGSSPVSSVSSPRNADIAWLQDHSTRLK